MRINEIFYSLQGEGSFTGTPAVFIRFSGCNTKCPFCDTQHEEYVEMTEDEILAEVKKYPANHVVITGGEPTLQLTPSLCQKLQENLFFVQIETNGSVKLDSKFNLKDLEESLIDWVTCSPKNLPIKIQRIDELKVLFDGEKPMLYMNDMNFYNHRFFIQEYRLQPLDDGQPAEVNRQKCIEYILRNPQWTLSLQTHKILNVK